MGYFVEFAITVIAAITRLNFKNNSFEVIFVGIFGTKRVGYFVKLTVLIHEPAC